MKRLLLSLLVAACVAIPTASARASGQTVSVSPNPVALEQTFVVSGCGYAPSSLLWVRIKYPAYYGGFGFYPTAGADGCFSFSYVIVDANALGTWDVFVNYANRKGSKNSVATTTFVVTS